jgi:predicted protein tyrosine phosphatase
MASIPVIGRATSVCGLLELDDYRDRRVSHVLSILDPDWPEPTAFDGFPDHRRLRLDFHDVIDDIPDRVPPARHHIEKLLAFGRAVGDGETDRTHVLVHCHAGISRSTAALALLLCQWYRLKSPRDVLAEVIRIRSQAWPNLRMIELGDELLSLGGALIAAAREHYRIMAALDPDKAIQLWMGGRTRELS